MRLIHIVFLTLAIFGMKYWLDRSGPKTPTTSPNLLVITFDTLRADHLGVYGGEGELSLNFDGLARESVMFSNVYAPSATTGPSHATIFTALHPNEHGVLKNGVVLADDVTTLAEVLSGEGYATAAFVSSFVMKGQFGWTQGFDEYNEKFNIPRRRLGHLTIEAASDWIADRDQDEPWFVWVHLMDPHKPYRQPEPFRRDYVDPSLKDKREIEKALYNGAVAYTDSVLPKLFETINSQHGPAKTLMAVTADHGELFGEHGHYGHGAALYEDVVRVPLIFNYPGVPVKVIEDTVGLVDFTPTVLDLLDIPFEDKVSGRSLVAAIDGDEGISHPVFMQRRIYDETSVKKIQKENGVNVSGPQWGFIFDGYKFVAAPEAGEQSLFRYLEDPAEANNLVDKEPKKAREMARMLEDFLSNQVLRVSQTELSDEVLSNLAELGYVK